MNDKRLCHVIFLLMPALLNHTFKVLFAPPAEGRLNIHSSSFPGLSNTLIAASFRGTIIGSSYYRHISSILNKDI